MSIAEERICKKCKRRFIYEFDSKLPEDIEYCPMCRGDEYNDVGEKVARALEKLMKDF